METWLGTSQKTSSWRQKEKYIYHTFVCIKLHRLQEKMPAITHTKSGYLFIVRVIVYTPRWTKWKDPPNKTLGYLISFQAFKGNPCYIKILVFRENNSSTLSCPVTLKQLFRLLRDAWLIRASLQTNHQDIFFSINHTLYTYYYKWQSWIVLRLSPSSSCFLLWKMLMTLIHSPFIGKLRSTSRLSPKLQCIYTLRSV